MFLLEIKDLVCTLRLDSVSYVRPTEKLVLRGLSLAMEDGTSLALLGESGSGKTTLARCVAGLQRPDSGTITFDGMCIFPAEANRVAVGARIQMLFQGGSASLDPTMTILETLVEGINARDGKTSRTSAREEAESLIASVGVPGECLGRLPRHLSGGQRQRVALARVLSVAPRLLILDEPTSALDALTAAQLLQLLKFLQQRDGFSMLYITHDVHAALAFCDRVAVVRRGVIVEEGPSRDLSMHPRHEYTAQLIRDSTITKI